MNKNKRLNDERKAREDEEKEEDEGLEDEVITCIKLAGWFGLFSAVTLGLVILFSRNKTNEFN
jgi:hypothetical protein